MRPILTFALLALVASMAYSPTRADEAADADAQARARAVLVLASASQPSTTPTEGPAPPLQSCACASPADCVCGAGCVCANCVAGKRPTDATASVTVIVPPDAEVWFDGEPTKQRGAERVFATPPLPAGVNHYDITARYCTPSGCYTQVRQVNVEPGSAPRVEFNFPQYAAPMQQFQRYAAEVMTGGFGGLMGAGFSAPCVGSS